MPYKSNQDLPDAVTQHLPEHGQTIYREAYNHAYTEYQSVSARKNKSTSAEVTANKVAWAAVKKKYKKGSDGHWHAKP